MDAEIRPRRRLAVALALWMVVPAFSGLSGFAPLLGASALLSVLAAALPLRLRAIETWTARGHALLLLYETGGAPLFLPVAGGCAHAIADAVYASGDASAALALRLLVRFFAFWWSHVAVDGSPSAGEAFAISAAIVAHALLAYRGPRTALLCGALPFAVALAPR